MSPTPAGELHCPTAPLESPDMGHNPAPKPPGLSLSRSNEVSWEHKKRLGKDRQPGIWWQWHESPC